MFRLALTLLLASHAVNPAFAQNTASQKKKGQSPSATAPDQPQSNPVNPLLQPIPFDHRITRDSLANGLKYFIKPNAKPEKKIELRLVVNAGSILENDNQQGMAHFIEHMNFNGTQNYPKNALVDYLQTIGVQFGADLNAYTSFDETVYILPIPTNNPDNVEKGFQVLSDWAQKALLTDRDIQEERSVILEESRGGKGADERLSRQYLPKLMAGSRYASRLPIGQDSIIAKGSAEALRDFYHSWYRPNLMAVIVSGDITVPQAKALIEKYFAGLTNPENVPPRPQFPAAQFKKKEAMVLTDPEATNQQFVLLYSAKPQKPKVILNDYREGMKERLFLMVLNNRLAELTQNSTPPFLGAYGMTGGWTRNDQSFQLVVIPNDNFQLSLKTAIGELERMRRYGITQSELDIAISALVSSMERSYNERKNRESESVVSELVRHFLQQENVPGIEYEYDAYLSLLPSITIADVNAVAVDWLSDNKAYFALTTGPSNSNLAKLSQKQLIKYVDDAMKQKIAKPKEKVVPQKLLKTLPTPGNVVKRDYDAEREATTFTFSNGVTVSVKKTDFMSDEILMYGSKWGGFERYASTKKASAQYLGDFIPSMGYGDFTPTQLSDYMTGKNASIYSLFYANKNQVTGFSSKKDLETMLQLGYLKMTSPRKDEALFQGMISATMTQIKDAKAEPMNEFQDSLSKLIYGNHPLMPIGIPTLADLSSCNADDCIEIYRKEFAWADGYHFVLVGNVDADSVLPLLAQYLGGLPVKGEAPKMEDIGLRQVKGKHEVKFYLGKEDKSLVIEKYYGERKHSDLAQLQLALLVDVLNIKIIEELREKIGGIYSGSASADYEREPYDHFGVIVALPCGSGSVDTLLKALHAEIKKLQVEGPTAKDLDEVKTARLQSHREATKTNGYWIEILMNEHFYPQDRAMTSAYEAAIEGVTSEQLRLLAQDIFSTENVFRGILYPAK